MKKILSVIMAMVLCFGFASCKEEQVSENGSAVSPEAAVGKPEGKYEEAIEIILTGDNATVDGAPANESSGAVSVGGEMIYYHNKDFYPSGNPYGEGENKDKHTEEEAAEYTLVTIHLPGEYYVTGNLKGQLAIDLGEDAESDPDAKVTLIFGGAEITCDIAPAVIFYNVYECGNGENESWEVDTSMAGANVIIADGTENNISGAYVAKIYKDNGESKKLHKYDAAFYSKMSMNISGEEDETGILNIFGENEGLDSEMHLTVNGGNININSQNDGINANEDGISVVAVNGGKLIVNGGLGEDGDGIDSNGWLIVNGGILYAYGSERSSDGGIDADNGIIINGGSVAAFGSRNDEVMPGENYTCVQLTFSSFVKAGSTVQFLDAEGYGMIAQSERDFLSLVLAGKNIEKDKEYYLYVNGIIQEYEGNLSSWETVRGPEENKEEDSDGSFALELAPAEGKTAFVITQETRNFSGIMDSFESTGKTRVSFMINKRTRLEDVFLGEIPEITLIESIPKVRDEDVILTLECIEKDEGKQLLRTCSLSDGYDAVSELFMDLVPGKYCLTVSVSKENSEYAGYSAFNFAVVS